VNLGLAQRIIISLQSTAYNKICVTEITSCVFA